MTAVTKRCCRCGAEKPRDEAHFDFRRGQNGRLYPNGRCRECEAPHQRELRARLLATDPARLRAKERAYRERRKADPERHAIRLDYNREWLRRARDVKPENYRVGRDAAPRRQVDVAPVREAIVSSGVQFEEIERAAGIGNGGVHKIVTRNETVRLDIALKILAAINVLPAEVGL